MERGGKGKEESGGGGEGRGEKGVHLCFGSFPDGWDWIQTKVGNQEYNPDFPSWERNFMSDKNSIT